MPNPEPSEAGQHQNLDALVTPMAQSAASMRELYLSYRQVGFGLWETAVMIGAQLAAYHVDPPADS